MTQELPDPCCATCRHWTALRHPSATTGHCALVRAYLAIGARRKAVEQALAVAAPYMVVFASYARQGIMFADWSCRNGYEPRT